MQSTFPSAVAGDDVRDRRPAACRDCQLSNTWLFEKSPSFIPGHMIPVPTACGHERLERRIVAVDVEVVRVEPVVVDLHPVRREPGMAAGREGVGREAVRVAVEVVLRHANRVAHRARVPHGGAVEVALLDGGVETLLRIERLVAELARLGRGAGVDDRVAGAESVAVLDHAVVGGEGEVAVVGVPEELHLVEQDAVRLLGVEAVLLRTAEQDVLHDEAVSAVAANDDVLGVAGVIEAVRGVEALLRRRAARRRRAGRSASSSPRIPCLRRGARLRAWRPNLRSGSCT